MIGIIGAMKMEVEGLKAQLKDPQITTISGIEFVTGKLKGTDVVLAVCGVGKVFAALCAQTICLQFPVTALLNTGVAGTLCPQLGIGDVAIARDVVQHDMDTSGLGDPVGMISGPNVVHIPAGESLVAAIQTAAGELGLATQTGTIATGDQFLCEAGRKEWIHNTFGAIAGEMEGGSIGQVCYTNGIPFGVIRVISDDADGNAPQDFPAFAAKAAQTSVALTARVVELLGNL